VVLYDGWSKGKNIVFNFLRIDPRLIVASLVRPLLVVKMSYFYDFIGWRLKVMSMIELLPGLLDLDEVLSLRVFICLVVENIRKCVLLVLEDLLVTVNDDVFIDIALFVLFDFFKGGWKHLSSFVLTVFDGLVIILSAGLKGSKGRIDHTVNY
jgi:hypothetical protein